MSGPSSGFRALAVLAGSALLAGAPATADYACDASPPVELSAADRQTLTEEGAHYRLKVTDDSEFKEGIAVAILESPAIRVYRVVTDNCNFEEFMPYVKDSCVDEGEDGAPINYQRLDSFLTPEIRYRIRLLNSWTDGPPGIGESSWTLVDGYDDLLESRGSWRVEDCGNGNSLVTYEVYTVPKGKVVQKFSNFATDQSLPKLIKKVRAQASELRYAEERSESCPCSPDAIR